MTESLRERCIRGMAVNDHPDLLKVAEHHLDRLLDVLEESDQELIQVTYPLNHGETFRKKLWAVLRGNGE